MVIDVSMVVHVVEMLPNVSASVNLSTKVLNVRKQLNISSATF